MHTSLIPWLDPANLIDGFGPYALLGVAFIVFAETGLLVGFLLPGDTLLISAGVLTVTDTFGANIFVVCAAISAAAFIGGEVGYLIGHKFGPSIFEKNESGFFSKKNVERTNSFFVRYGGLAVIIARFVPVVRTFAPVAAGDTDGAGTLGGAAEQAFHFGLGHAGLELGVVFLIDLAAGGQQAAGEQHDDTHRHG